VPGAVSCNSVPHLFRIPRNLEASLGAIVAGKPSSSKRSEMTSPSPADDKHQRA